MKASKPFMLCIAALMSLMVVRGQGIDCQDFDASKLDPANDADYCRYQIDVGNRPEVGNVCLAHPEDILPTQAAFGEVDANCVQRQLEHFAEKKDGQLKDYLIKHLAPSVLGPNGTVYITDHHHLSVALLHAFLPYKKPYYHRTLYVCITHDFSQLEAPVFWKGMEEKALVFLQDNFGQEITVDELPGSVKYLRDDPYRTLAMYARESFGFVKCGQSETNDFKQCKGGKVEAKPFLEFRWGNVFRDKFPSKGIYTESDQMQVLAFEGYLNDVVRFSLDPQNTHLEGFNQEPGRAKPVSLDQHGCVIEGSGPGSGGRSDSDSDSNSDSDSDEEEAEVLVEIAEWFSASSTA